MAKKQTSMGRHNFESMHTKILEKTADMYDNLLNAGWIIPYGLQGCHAYIYCSQKKRG